MEVVGKTRASAQEEDLTAGCSPREQTGEGF